MPLLAIGADVVAKTKAKASVANAKWDAIKTLLNVTKLDADNIQDAAIIAQLLADGAVTGVKLDPALLAALGVNDGTNVRRGKVTIPTEESRTNTAYGLMSTPDRVQNVVVPTTATVKLEYSALWKESAVGTARAAIYCKKSGGTDTQFKIRNSFDDAPTTQAAAMYTGSSGPSSNTYRALGSFVGGLVGVNTPNNAHVSDVTTGQAEAIASVTFGGGGSTFPYLVCEIGGVIFSEYAPSGEMRVYGGACSIRNLAAGTYDFSVQFKSSSGSVTVKERELKITVEGF